MKITAPIDYSGELNMEKHTKLRIAAITISLLTTLCSVAKGQEEEEQNKPSGEVRLRYDYFFVDKDDGRFREDQWKKDKEAWVLDRFFMESNGPDKNGYEWLIEGRALYDYDYRFKVLMNKPDSHYIKLDFTGLRRYYDGSNEYWDQSLYALPGSDPFGTSEHRDGDLFIDRRNYNIELGITPPEGLSIILGWHRLERDGKEVLWRGGRARIAGEPDFFGIPAVSDVDGTTDTFYVELAHTFAEKYNFRVRQEWEDYRDKQKILFPYFDTGSLDSDRTFLDDPGYKYYRTMLMFDSFLDEETYVTANYMYDYLNNDSTRNVVRPRDASPNFFINNQVGNSRRTNVGAFGYSKTNLLPNLHLNTGVRIEDSATSSSSSGLLMGSTTRTARSSLDESRVEEMLQLTYKANNKTTFSFDVDLEQRHLDWQESETGAPTDARGRKADIDHQDQMYSIKSVHRFNNSIKSTVRFRIKDNDRNYSNRFRADADPGFDPAVWHPGHIGDYRIKGNDLTWSTDIKMNSQLNSTLMYQFMQESIDTSIGGKTQNFEAHRGSASMAYTATSNLFFVTTAMLENYTLDTPAQGSGTNSISGKSSTFDYSGNSYSLLFDAAYAFNEKTDCVLGFQHTEAMGTTDYAGDYTYDKVALSLKHELAQNQSVEAGYQFINYNNHPGGSFDDYQAHGLQLIYSYAF
jgi:hypothetical protein